MYCVKLNRQNIYHFVKIEDGRGQTGRNQTGIVFPPPTQVLMVQHTYVFTLLKNLIQRGKVRPTQCQL